VKLFGADEVPPMKRKQQIYRSAGTCTGVESCAHCMEIQKMCILRRLGSVEKFWSNAEKMKSSR
jgi:hypothetical protein